MRSFFYLLITLVCCRNTVAQQRKDTAQILTVSQVNEIFSDSVRSKLRIRFPIFRVYKYWDKAGEHYCILTESKDKITDNEITGDKDTLNNKIRALNVKVNKGAFINLWTINDSIQKVNDESSVWFWTKYVDFKDWNADGLVDPVIIYGSMGYQGYDNGRIVFMIYLKGQRILIRHQNGSLDFERETRVDKAFYSLPQSLQASIKRRMELMEENDVANFPAGWQNDMKNKKTIINERQ